ncbi:hypothetical protein ACHAXN_006692 [Cyclotella atomus]
MSSEDSHTTDASASEEARPLSSNNEESLDQRILQLVHQCPLNDSNQHVIRPAYLASQLGLSLDDATSELCGLMSAVGGGEDGASFVFEKVETPDASTMTMVFTFPSDFEARALSYRRKMNWYQRLVELSTVVVKAVKIFTAFGLIISLAVLMIAGICLLVAAVVAMARGGGQRGNQHQVLMHKLRMLLIQLRQILWLYAICGGGSQDDPFMREVAGDLALMLSCCVGNPMHMWFWMRMGGRRRRGGGLFGLSERRGWRMGNWRVDNTQSEGDDGVAMIRRGSWNNNQNNPQRSESSSSFDSQTSIQQQRGLLSVAVEFLFGPNESSNSAGFRQGLSAEELDKWKFRAAIIMSLSAAAEGRGVSLRELLPYTDNPPASENHAAALRETMKIITYFNGKPADNASSEATGGIDACFHFPEIMAEMETGIYDVSQKIMSLGSSDFAAPLNNETKRSITSLLYKHDEEDDANTSSGDIPHYLYEKPKFLTHLSRQQFVQCLFLGTLNFIGIISVQSSFMPGGVFDLSIAAAMAADANVSGATGSRRRKRYNSDMWIAFGSAIFLKLLKVLRFYANIFFLFPLIRLVILMINNYLIDRRNQRRLSYVTE